MTLCAFQRECLFGAVEDGVMRLNDAGQVVLECWENMPDHFPHVELDAFVVMPNHVHAIFVLKDDEPIVGATHASPGSMKWIATGPGPKPRSIGAIVGSFKSAASKRINETRSITGTPIWQRNYYERVIRNDRELATIRQYIADNPAKWAEDENHPSRYMP